MSIRRRLVVVVLLVVAVALGAIGATTYVLLDDYLVHQVDQGLDRFVQGQDRRLLDAQGGVVLPVTAEPDDTTRPFRTPNPYFVQVRDAAGEVVFTRERRIGETIESAPSLPVDLQSSGTVRTTVDSLDGSTTYRLRIDRVGTDLVVVGASLADVESTLDHVLLIEVIGGVVVLVAVASLSMWLVRVGLHPLRAVQRATTTIASGDYGHRVAVVDPSTEVGELATSFNSMLEQIESSFTERQATEERLRRFVADASHELKTPLTSIRGYAELYRAGVLTEPADIGRALGRIEQEATRMGALVEDLLLLARLDEGRPIEHLPVDLAALAADAVEDARAVEPQRHVDLHVPATPVVVSGDRAKLTQVLVNLLSNVRAHAGDGATIDVTVRVEGSNGLLAVHDTGTGMPPEVLARAFDRFFRADEGRSRADDHAGLGLSIVASIVQAHGGRVSADSTLGGGTTVTCVVPLAAPSVG